MFFPSVEKRESGPRHLDRTSDEFYAPESEVTKDRIDAADDLWGDDLDDAIEANCGKFTL